MLRTIVSFKSVCICTEENNETITTSWPKGPSSSSCLPITYTRPTDDWRWGNRLIVS